MAKHVKPRKPGQLRALVLGLIHSATAALFLAGGSRLGFVFVVIAALYLLSWRFDFRD